MKRKVKICMNLRCENRVNNGNVTVCTGCGMELRNGIKFLDDNEIEKILHPEAEKVMQEEVAPAEEVVPELPKELVICPACGERIPYRVGLEFCPVCKEYVQDEVPIIENCEGEEQEIIQEVAQRSSIHALKSVDGAYRLELEGSWIKIGRLSTGQEYFQRFEKKKVSREHAILSKKDGEWHISYCKKEDRNYTGGLENPIYINQRKMEKNELYKLQAGDRIAFGEADIYDPMAAFFDVE